MALPKMADNGQNSVFAFQNMTAPGRRTRKPGKFKNSSQSSKRIKTIFGQISEHACSLSKFKRLIFPLFVVHKGTYYRNRLSGSRLRNCYEIAPPRIKQYLDAEIKFVSSNLHGTGLALELGCGYGRVMKDVAPLVSMIIGNDISRKSLKLAKSYMKPCENYTVVQMDASNIAFPSCTFETVFCIQNGISAFGVDKKRLIAESIRVTKNNGIILFSSYSPKIWKDRLHWFRKQSQTDLLGEIDEERTHDGTIVCKDGFRATTVNDNTFVELFDEFGFNASIYEVDESSIFCKVTKKR
jgi:ubiquinone/menaquinone biosynthesis C-methylase UbiE